MMASYETLRLNEVKDELRKRGLRVSGTKTVLIQRLVNSDNNVVSHSPKRIPSHFSKKLRTLIQSIQQNEIVDLDLLHSMEDDDAIPFIMKALGENTSVESVRLRKISMRTVPLDDERRGGRMIRALLQTNTHIKCLSLMWCYLDPEDVLEISEGLKMNCTLKTLYLSHCLGGYRKGEPNTAAISASYIASAMKTNTTLTKLDLRNNALRSVGIETLCDALRDNVMLESLSLSWNGCKAKGAVMIAKSLETNTHLRRLNFSINRIGNEGVCAFAHLITVNTTLGTLNIEMHEGDESGKRTLRDAFHKSTIKKLNF